ncbi:MAG: RNA-guided endonuclease InsQ/TnpB family protein [Cyanophyceae cyanobacterium]
MILAHVYKLKPSPSQSALMHDWLNMLRAHYNFSLRDRIEAYEQARSPVLGNYSRLDNQGRTRHRNLVPVRESSVVCCPLTCSVNKTATVGYPWTKVGKRRSAGMQQDAYLPEMKSARPWYKRINSDVLQTNLRRLNDAFNRFFDGLEKYPQFKTRSKFRSFSYKPKQVKMEGNRVYLPGLGWMRFYLSRPLPEGFEIRTVTVRRKSDGWHMSVRLENEDVPSLMPKETSQIGSAIAVDLGIRKLAALSNGELVENPRFSKRVERRKRIRQKAAARKIKGSKNRASAYRYLAKLDQKVARGRADYHWKLANQLARAGDAIIFEALNIRGMMARCKPKQCPETGKYLKNGQAAKRGLNRVIADAGWGELKLKTKAVAAKLGLIVCEVDPKFSSQECSECGYISPVNRDKEKFLCEACGYFCDADTQASHNLLQRGLKSLGISPAQLRGVPSKVTPRSSAQP